MRSFSRNFAKTSLNSSSHLNKIWSTNDFFFSVLFFLSLSPFSSTLFRRNFNVINHNHSIQLKYDALSFSSLVKQTSMKIVRSNFSCVTKRKVGERERKAFIFRLCCFFLLSFTEHKAQQNFFCSLVICLMSFLFSIFQANN